MDKHFKRLQFQSGNIFLSLVVICFSYSGVRATALDDYVAMTDSHYFYEQVGDAVYDGDTFTRGYILDLTSQAWRESSEVDHVIWNHWVTVIVPELDWLLRHVPPSPRRLQSPPKRRPQSPPQHPPKRLWWHRSKKALGWE